MPCYYPITGYPSKIINPSGKRSIVFNYRQGFNDLSLRVVLSCGRCIGCRLRKSLEWSIRCMHEASLWKDNVFITLTYDEKNNPDSLCKQDFQKFMKRLRKYFAPKKIRFFAGGEYGTKTKRPHYHAILFNCNFPDQRLINTNENCKYSDSKILTDLWGKGYCTIGQVTQKSAQYVAKYVVKKLTGKEADEKYGEKKPEFGLMSLKPAIGYDWVKQNSNDIYNHDTLVLSNGKITRPPKIYDKIFSQMNFMYYNQLVQKRKTNAKEFKKRRNDLGYCATIAEKVKKASMALCQTKL